MGTNRQFDKNSRSKTYKEINRLKKKTLKMKFSIAIIATAFASEDTIADDTWVGPMASNSTVRSGNRQINSGERRYDDLESIASKYWRKQGLTGKAKFDDRKYWTYGR